MLWYARVLIEMNVDGPFPEFLEFFNENDMLVRPTVKYEWLPTKCAHCNMFGHIEDQCRKKNGIPKEWRRVQHDQPTENIEVSLPTQSSPKGPPPDSEDGFIIVTRKVAPLQAPQSVPGPKQTNDFQVLAMKQEKNASLGLEKRGLPHG